MRVRPRHVIPRGLAEVAHAFSAVAPVSGSDVHVTGIALTTRDLVPGDLFAALPGGSTHGARFGEQAVAAGAVAVLTDALGASLIAQEAPELPVLVAETSRLRRDVAAFSADFYGHPAAAMVTLGITGTQGKTTTTYLAEAAVGVTRSATIGTIGTRVHGERVESQLTTPEAPALQALFAVMREEHVATCAMEVSSHALVQGRVDGFVFDTAVFLNLGRDHLDFHADMDDYFDAKAQLFTPTHAARGLVNIDDEWGRRLVAEAAIPVLTYSTQGRAADWRGVNIRTQRSSSDLTLLGPGGLEVPVHVPLSGEFNVSNAVAAIAARASVSPDIEGEFVAELAAGLATSTGVPGRMERVAAGQDFDVVVDYAHKPEAITAVLAALRPITPGRLVMVLGAGGDRDHGKRPLMGAAAAALADLLIVTDDNPRSESPAAIRAAVVEGARGHAVEVVEIGDRREAISAALTGAHRGDTVVIAGKGHETGQHIGGVVHPFDDKAVALEVLGVGQGTL
jgi:UDP-N-acetylmuramoyl-L-alanyl-D-glutamate--2,6-diaminopimelate ligase